MVKMKKIYANCKICKRQITIEVSDDIAKDREYYPFEYIDIHGDPEHALMLFLDQNLAVRDAIAYQDIQLVKKKGSQYRNLVRMSETDAFASIYINPLCTQLFMKLIEGPQIEDDLIVLLKKNEEFIEEEFNMLILPLIRSGLVKTKWLQDTFQMCYFLVKDFVVFRTSSKIISNMFLNNDIFKPYSEIYFRKLNATLYEFKQKFLSGIDAQIKETRLCLRVRSTLKFLSVLNLLRDGPQTLNELSRIADDETIKELIENNFIIEIKTKTESYYALLTDIRIKKFTPNYLISPISQKFNENQIDKEMVLGHFDLLFDSEASS